MERTSTNRRRGNRTGIEENTLAIVESTEAKDTQDADDDRISFLEAVRASSFASEVAVPPTNKMYEAVLQILRVGKSLELIMSSYQLLIDLDKHFPQVFVSKSHELVVVDEAWSPFAFSSDVASNESRAAGENSSGLLDFSGFALLIEELVEIATVENLRAMDTKNLRNMLLFQYLVSFLEGDFLPRKTMYAETMNWTILRESFLNMLLGSRRINYKNLMKDCLSILCGLSQVYTGMSDNRGSPENSNTKPSEDCNPALAFALLQVGKSTCIAMQKFLIIIMGLDNSKKNADMQGQTTRADGVRTPVVEIVLDELTYNVDMLLPFLQPSVRTRRSNGPVDDATFTGILNWFSSSTGTKSILKKISIQVIQLLLAHGFQALLLLSSQNIEGVMDSKEETRESSLVEICKSMICAFQSLKRTNEEMEILPISKEALFTAATILSMN
ncbi:negative regulator of systemic acquired resistance SNI1 [Citrus sinensis]|uniref:negative regulator of systemic acquired resistance SNI1 isoform X2 n=1 Tax=Citrus sinensis TaxID=2711 RepID=UPI0003D6DCAD|nr:negative regulator of systemic acquired resistance SNI1 isoform X2 [Citrus sinensis]KAH9748920.1 negative regulator of systemic acquired resistance SNI1 [Citrus sinensis]